MNLTAVLNTLFQANQLKLTARTGWTQRGVPEAENVAAHSYGVAFTALLLAHLVEEPLDLGRLLAMALLHDLPEALTTDIPTTAWRFFPVAGKRDGERSALAHILAGLPFAPGLTAWWEEVHLDASAEARLVHDADRLDLYLQALRYEQQTGNHRLAEFWQVATRFHYPQAQAIYDTLRTMRQAAPSNSP